jgi:hypothetical protein
MATYTKQFLSTSENGGGTIVTSTTSGTPDVIHNSSTSPSIIDEVWAYAYNSSSASVTLNLLHGGGQYISLSVPSKSGLTLVIPGLLLKGNGESPGPLWAYASISNVITISGYVNRIT